MAIHEDHLEIAIWVGNESTNPGVEDTDVLVASNGGHQAGVSALRNLLVTCGISNQQKMDAALMPAMAKDTHCRLQATAS